MKIKPQPARASKQSVALNYTLQSMFAKSSMATACFGNSSDSDLSAVTHASALTAGRWIRYQVDSARSAVINDITGERREEASLSSLQLQHVYSPKHNEVFFTHRRKDKETYYSDVTDAKNVIYRESLPLGATTLPPQS